MVAFCSVLASQLLAIHVTKQSFTFLNRCSLQCCTCTRNLSSLHLKTWNQTRSSLSQAICSKGQHPRLRCKSLKIGLSSHAGLTAAHVLAADYNISLLCDRKLYAPIHWASSIDFTSWMKPYNSPSQSLPSYRQTVLFRSRDKGCRTSVSSVWPAADFLRSMEKMEARVVTLTAASNTIRMKEESCCSPYTATCTTPASQCLEEEVLSCDICQAACPVDKSWVLQNKQQKWLAC